MILHNHSFIFCSYSSDFCEIMCKNRPDTLHGRFFFLKWLQHYKICCTGFHLSILIRTLHVRFTVRNHFTTLSKKEGTIYG